jgi:hypothetical protein
MFEAELKEYIYNSNSEDLRGFCCGIYGLAAPRRPLCVGSAEWNRGS